MCVINISESVQQTLMGFIQWLQPKKVGFFLSFFFFGLYEKIILWKTDITNLE